MNNDEKNIPITPTDLVKHDGKQYKWMVPKFKLPGYKETFISSEVSDDTFILEKILEIEGQGLLIEQV